MPLPRIPFVDSLSGSTLALLVAVVISASTATAAVPLAPFPAHPIMRGTPAITAGPVPKFVPQKLALKNTPEGSGPVESLFNGKDLTDWDLWLGFENPAITYAGKKGIEPVGSNTPPAGTAGVAVEEGEPVIVLAGRLNGSLMHRGDFHDYHAHVEYKFADEIPANPAERPNSGLLFHSFDVPGSAFGTWAGSIEFQMQHGSNGMSIPVGRKANGLVKVGIDEAGFHRFMPAGVDRELRGRPQTEPNADVERPIGTWNAFDLYVVGDHAIYVVNGIPVMEVHDLSVENGDGSKSALTHGHLQLELEGAKTFFRHITVQSIKTLPEIVVR